MCSYKTYNVVRGVVIEEDNHYYIRIYMDIELIKYITDNEIVKIDNNEYKYKIISMDSEYFTDDITTYQIVKIEVDLDNKYRYNNLTLTLKFLKENKRIIDYILN